MTDKYEEYYKNRKKIEVCRNCKYALHKPESEYIKCKVNDYELYSLSWSCPKWEGKC